MPSRASPWGGSSEQLQRQACKVFRNAGWMAAVHTSEGLTELTWVRQDTISSYGSRLGVGSMGDELEVVSEMPNSTGEAGMLECRESEDCEDMDDRIGLSNNGDRACCQDTKTEEESQPVAFAEYPNEETQGTGFMSGLIAGLGGQVGSWLSWTEPMNPLSRGPNLLSVVPPVMRFGRAPTSSIDFSSRGQYLPPDPLLVLLVCVRVSATHIKPAGSQASRPLGTR
jgi:hypothetical protein